ncbi:MAG: hypothetical protein OXI38_08885 [Bacteroidota bacterium]|nr:hypothetical protein [Bacteroidota bacterium]
MIHPTKHIPIERSLLGAGAELYTALSEPRTVTTLWEAVREVQSIESFERFVLALTMLYALRVVRLDGGMIRRSEPT